MCTFRNIIRIRTPLYTNFKHASFSTFECTNSNLETVEMSYNIYETTNDPKSNTTAPIIVMHGLLGSKTNWNSLCKTLHQKTQRTILSVDARNHGESPHSASHSYELLAEDIRALFNRLGIKKYTLLGHSMGGRAMMYFALRYPNLVDKLIVGDVSPISTSPSLNTIPSLFSIMEKVKLPSNIPISTARIELNKELSSSIENQGLRSFLLTNLKQNSDGSLAWQMNLKALQTNFVEHIAQFPKHRNMKYNGPVLFLAGGNSDYLREDDYSEILKLFPMAEFKRIPGAGHWLHSEKPAEFLQLSLEFLNRKRL